MSDAERILREWARRFGARAREAGVRIPDLGPEPREALERAAALVALVGPPDDPEAEAAFGALSTLLMVRDRVDAWPEAVAAIPGTRSKVAALSGLVAAYSALAAEDNDFSPLTTRGLDLAAVVPVMVRVAPHREVFLAEVRKRWPRWPGKIFSEETVGELARLLRGAFGEFADEWEDHGRQIEDNVKVIGGGA